MNMKAGQQRQEDKLRRSFGMAFARFLRRIVRAARLSSRYRPELHYMRGPGPKSRAKTAPRMTADIEMSTAASQRNG
jgi:hypothetical protein